MARGGPSQIVSAKVWREVGHHVGVFPVPADTRPRNTAGSSVGPVARSVSRMATADGDSGTRCCFLFFACSAGTVHHPSAMDPPTPSAPSSPPRCAVKSRSCHHAATAGGSVSVAVQNCRISSSVSTRCRCVLLSGFDEPIGGVRWCQIPIDREAKHAPQQRGESVRADRGTPRRHAFDQLPTVRPGDFRDGARSPRGQYVASQLGLIGAPGLLFRARVLVEIEVHEVRDGFGGALRLLHRRRIAAGARVDDGGTRTVCALSRAGSPSHRPASAGATARGADTTPPTFSRRSV